MLFTVLDAAVKPIELVGNVAAGAASGVFPPSSMVFGAAMYLINAARGVSASLDAITDLLGSLKDFTVRLNIYTREALSSELRDKLVETLITVVEILARSSKVISEGRLVNALKNFSKNLLLGNDQKMQGLMSKLDKLTSSESHLVGAETLVETKKTTRNIEAVQIRMTENTAKLSGISITTTQTAQGVTEVLTVLEEQRSQAREDKDLKHLDSVKKILKFSTSAHDRYDEIRREHVLGSGDWIYSEHAFQRWLDQKSSVLWVSGNPGSGKSFLTYNMIDKLHERHQDQSGSAGHDTVGFFFFRDNKDQTRSMSQALRDIAWQLAQSDALYARHVVSHSDEEVTSIRSAWQKLFADFYLDEDAQGSAYILFDGIDEAFEEDRLTFFELLKDVENAGRSSRLHVAMIGRPQIIDEIMDHLEQQVPVIHVDSTKNGTDIANYVELSIAKSRVLKGVSQQLKEEIVSTLSSRAGGMFMWVKLMVAELNKKTREPAIREALNKAPKGLKPMLEHVLEGYSTTLAADEADDLNDLLKWVALAKRPLALGELDAMLRLKSPEGSGVLNLEGMMRERFASLFTLTREDALTTAELQARQRLIEEDEEVPESAISVTTVEGLDDVEHSAEYESNIRTTTVSFSHASISDFFRDAKQGKVAAQGDDHPAVGVDVEIARVQVARKCLDLIVDETLQPRMKDAVSLQWYSAFYWLDHLKDIETGCLTLEDKVEIARNLARMLQEDALLRIWANSRDTTFFSADAGRALLPYLIDEAVREEITSHAAWVSSKVANPIELFEPAVKYTAMMWLIPTLGRQWVLNVCCDIIFAYLERVKGEKVDDEPEPSAEQIITTAEWAGYEQTAEWCRRVAVVLRDNEWYDVAIEYFSKAIGLDSCNWIARIGISILYEAQSMFSAALEVGLESLELAKNDDKMDATLKQSHIHSITVRTADCYKRLSYDAETTEDKIGLRKRGIDLYLDAYRNGAVPNYNAVRWALCLMFDLIRLGRMEPAGEATVHTEAVDIPSKHELYSKIFDIVHDMADTETAGGGQTRLTACLIRLHDDDVFFQILVHAAQHLDQIEWLQGRYREAVTWANKHRLTLIAAFLSLSLAKLHYQYGDGTTDDKAIHIWEALGAQGSDTTQGATEIVFARSLALNALGACYIRKAFEDEAKASRWIGKIERLSAKRTIGARLGAPDTVPPNDMAIYLAAWKAKHGQLEEAKKLARAHVKDALYILSDDDPDNDSIGYRYLAYIFQILGDERNAIAAYQVQRVYNDEDEAVLVSEKTAGAGNEMDDDDDYVGACDGDCVTILKQWDNVHWCRWCGTSLEEGCFQRLQNGTLAVKICGAHHEFLLIPALTRSFKKGELLVGDEVVTLESWKAGIKKEWGL